MLKLPPPWWCGKTRLCKQNFQCLLWWIWVSTYLKWNSILKRNWIVLFVTPVPFQSIAAIYFFVIWACLKKLLKANIFLFFVLFWKGHLEKSTKRLFPVLNRNKGIHCKLLLWEFPPLLLAVNTTWVQIAKDCKTCVERYL